MIDSRDVHDEAAGVVERVRAICMAFPEVTERLSHGSPAFFAGGKAQFAHLWPDGHHDLRFAHLWCAAPPGAQSELAREDPATYFRPPYVGTRGWVGVRLDRDQGWERLPELCEDAYRTVAPKRLVALLEPDGS